jgi:hypothetical protein
MAGATRPNFCADFQLSALVRAAVKPATSQSRHHVRRNRRTAQRDTDNETRIIKNFYVILQRNFKQKYKPSERT